jgi:hypothetical protein
MILKKKKGWSGSMFVLKFILFASIIIWMIIFSWGIQIVSRQKHEDAPKIFVAYTGNLQSEISNSMSSKDRCEKEFQRVTINHTHNLTKEDLRRSRAWVGNEQRLQFFAEKLYTKKNSVSVVVYGGSISMGHGLQDTKLKYLNQFENWMNEQYPTGNKQHRVYSRAGHGADICFVSKRLMMMLDDIPTGQDIDMFVLEFAVNDYQG